MQETHVGGQAILSDELLASASSDRLMADLKVIAAEDRAPGGVGERRAFDYIERQLRELPASVTRYEMSGFVSTPVKASLRVTSMGHEESIRCITHSGTASTPAGGYRAPLVSVGRGVGTDFVDAQAGGRIALVSGRPTATGLQRAEAASCAVQVFIEGSPIAHHHLTSLAGNPTDDALAVLPTSVAVSISDVDGARLLHMLEVGPVEAWVTAEVETGWRTLPLIVADIAPDDGESTFAFFGAHVDSWYEGVIDNGAGTAALLEIARAIAANRAGLKRGVRLLFWSGHEHGLYAGSSWYVDNHWQELYDRAIVALAIDSPGAGSPTHLARSKVMDEVAHIAAASASTVTTLEVPQPRRPQNGEQPLWRIGVPSLSPDKLTPEDRSWMHTVDDQLELVDPAVLLQDTQIHLLALWSVISADRLPFRYDVLARGIAQGLEPLTGSVDFRETIALAETLEKLSTRLDELTPASANEVMRRLGRLLIPVLYTRAGAFELDTLAVKDAESEAPKGFLVGVQDARRLAHLEPGSRLHHGTSVRIVRQRNRLEFALRSAIEVCEFALAHSPSSIDTDQASHTPEGTS